MKVHIKANFGIAGIEGDHMDIRGRSTLGELLSDLAKGSEFPFILPDGKLDPEVEVLLNGLEYPFLPKRLETELKEDDQVEIMMLSIGGG